MKNYVVIEESKYPSAETLKKLPKRETKNMGLYKSYLKRFTAFDGCGSFHFNTERQALDYSYVRSKEIEKALNFALSQFAIMSKYYIDNLIRCKEYDRKYSELNDYLKDSLQTIDWLSKPVINVLYVLPKVFYLLDRYKSICEILNNRIMGKAVDDVIFMLTLEYETYDSREILRAKQEGKVKRERARKSDKFKILINSKKEIYAQVFKETG